ncbi:MAG: TonB-dependent receptor family protein, partial [Bacteroidaceae bacterium]|nr:TonB-dependent receptor family protein [Bacteroidaceae bacterium]
MQPGVDWNVDGLFDKTKTLSSTTETSLTPSPSLGGEGSIYNNRGEGMVDVTTPLPIAGGAGGGAFRTIENNTLSSNNFWATKLILSYPVWKGSLSVGGEYSYNHRTDAYSFLSAEALPVKATDTEINEKSAAAFVEYGRQFDLSTLNSHLSTLYVQVGLRYEHLTNDYFNFGVREDEVCRDYGDWFPTATLSMPVGKVQLSLSYRKDIERPGYSNLTSSTVYINRYTYQSGNPYLRPTYTHNLSLNAAYKWAGLVVTYSHTKDNVTMDTEQIPGADDPMVSLVRYI